MSNRWSAVSLQWMISRCSAWRSPHLVPMAVISICITGTMVLLLNDSSLDALRASSDDDDVLISKPPFPPALSSRLR